MQRSVSVQRLRVPLDDVVPLHAQVDEASGLNLLSFSVENVMPRCLVLDCCNQLFVMSRWQSWSSITLSFKNKKKFWIIQWDKKNQKNGVIHGTFLTPGTCLRVTMSDSFSNSYKIY